MFPKLRMNDLQTLFPDVKFTSSDVKDQLAQLREAYALQRSQLDSQVKYIEFLKQQVGSQKAPNPDQENVLLTDELNSLRRTI